MSYIFDGVFVDLESLIESLKIKLYFLKSVSTKRQKETLITVLSSIISMDTMDRAFHTIK